MQRDSESPDQPLSVRTSATPSVPPLVSFGGASAAYLVCAVGVFWGSTILVVAGGIVGIGLTIAFLLGWARSATAQHESALSVAPELVALKSRLSRWQFDQKLTSFAERAMSQLQRAQHGSVEFKQILDQKLNPGELTYGRYLAVGRDFLSAICANLAKVAETFEQSALTANVAKDEINTRLDEGEALIAKFASAQQAVAQIASTSETNDTSTSAAMRELEDLVARAKRLSEKQGAHSGEFSGE